MQINKSIFRKYDIRGIYPSQINEKIISKIGDAISLKCNAENINEIFLGRDGRLSGKTLLDELSKSLVKNGIKVIDLGLISTPLLYFAAKKNQNKSGIMITGSHNPKNYNGLKLVINDKPVSGDEIYKIVISNNEKNYSLNHQGEIKRKDIKKEYIQEVKKNIITDAKRKIKVVIDCGNGAAGVIAPNLYRELGFEVIEMYSEIDGNFPNHHPDPGNINNLKDLISKVKKENADLGLAFDGDGDRIGLVSNLGEIIFPDKILMMLSKDILSKEIGSIIFDVKCSNALEEIISDSGGKPIMSPTGHFHIKNRIKKYSPLLAGEMSGHIFFNDKWFGFDDGHYAGARIIELLCKRNLTIAEIDEELPKLFSTPELNIDVDDEEKFQIVDEFASKCSINGDKILIDGIRINFKNGWALLRASNTTPKLVFRFEGRSQKDLNQIKNIFLNELARICPSVNINLIY